MKRTIAFLLSFVLLLSVGSTLFVSRAAETEGTGEYGVDWFYYGDIDGDRAIGAKDALEVLKVTVGKAIISEDQRVVGEVTGDTLINAKDALEILKFSVGKVVSFTPGRIYQKQVEDDGSDNNSNTAFDTTNSYNGAYEKDETADTSFVMDNTGLAPNTIYVLTTGITKAASKDAADVLESNDMLRLVVSLQGLVNRDFGMDENHSSIIYYSSDQSDSTWLNEMLKEGVYKGFTKVTVTNKDRFFEIFAHQLQYCGMVVWDNNVWATSNVAATMCGIDGYLPVRSGSTLLTKLKGMGVSQKSTLVGKFKNNGSGQISGTTVATTGSAKNDAYLWALEKYGNRCSAKYVAYTLDAAATTPGSGYETNGMVGLVNHDYLIARRAFFYDLAPYTGDVACDDPAGKVGLDAQTMRKIFQKRYDRANGEIGMNMGFPPWWSKYNKDYNKGSLPAGTLEPYFAELVTCYNLAMEADAADLAEMTNGSAYYKYVPTLEKYENTKPATTMKYDNSKYYFIFYIGDYDSSAWMKEYVYTMWLKQGGDRKRGKVNMMWSYNPNLSYRIPMAFDYIYKNKSDKDYFAAGDSGAGYVNPTAFFPGVTLSQSKTTRPSSTGDGSSKWIAYCQEFYEKLDLDITGFIINTGNSFDKKIMDMYNQISPVGSTYYNGNDNRLLINNGVPYIQTRIGVGPKTCKLNGVEVPTAQYMYDWQSNNMKGYHFASYRSVSWTPSEISEVVDSYIAYADGKGKTVEYVDPYNFFDLIKQSGQGVTVN